MVIRINVWIPGHFFIFFTITEMGIFVHLLLFLIQSTADLYHTWQNDWRWLCIHNILGQIPQTSRSGLIRKSGFESMITFGWNFGVGRGLHSLSALVNIAILRENGYRIQGQVSGIMPWGVRQGLLCLAPLAKSILRLNLTVRHNYRIP